MKILDPQSALLTNAEVHTFLSSLPAYTPPPKIGAYPPVNTTGYKIIREDLSRYFAETTPHLAAYPKEEKEKQWMSRVVRRLKEFGLEKTEVLQLINLGVGTEKRGVVEGEVNGNGNGEGDVEMAEEGQEQSGLGRQLLGLVVEEIDERFPEEKIEGILKVLREELGGEVGDRLGNGVNGVEKVEELQEGDGEGDVDTPEEVQQVEHVDGVKAEGDGDS